MTAAEAPVPVPQPRGNTPEYSVSELSQALKRTVEDRYSNVRVRGELSGWKRHASGHCYFCMKDSGAALDAVLWRSKAGALGFAPEDGLEVIATGKLSTYPDRSKYQLVVERLEPAGAGALLAQLERRRAMLAAEGLFDPARKRPLPYLPRVIGVVTSPTGAVIRDILHRLADRFPRHVLLWPVPVQGEGAAAKVAAAIAGLNALPEGFPRPDIIIVARGGGSIEDLWAFNEEAVARAVAGSAIPIISAVGHETDTTLCDHAADMRAPTPTAAAEMAVPVRAELLAAVAGLGARQARCATRALTMRGDRLELTARRLPRPQALLGLPRQRLDALADRLPLALARPAARCRAALAATLRAFTPSLLASRAAGARRDLADRRAMLARAADANRALGLRAAERWSERLRPSLLDGRARDAGARLRSLARLLETLSPAATLRRGYAVVRTEEGAVLTTAAVTGRARGVEIEFQDGRVAADIRHAAARSRTQPRQERLL